MPRAGTLTHRPDVHALRALAVLSVVAFHMGVPHMDGGFVGVDVFFVLSGFLITRQLVLEHGREGRISFSRFYSRRIRRLLPLSALVLLVTLVAGAFLVSPFDFPSIAADVGWSAAYVSNWRFIASGEDYFGIIPSPVTHYWSLAVEEQFYVLWPLVLLFLLRRDRRWLKRGVIVLAVASFAHSLAESSLHPTLAYYSSTTRTWQLLAGALVAIYLPHGLIRLTRLQTTVVALVGVLVLATAVLFLDATYAYPGLVGLIPVLGTATVLVASPGPSSPLNWLMTLYPVRLLGDLSYGWYLWHWPAIVYGELLIANQASVRVVMGIVSLGLAWATYHVVENPLRRGEWLRRPRRTGMLAASSCLVLVAASMSTFALAEKRLQTPRFAAIEKALSETGSGAGPDCFTPDVEMLLQECRGGALEGPRLVLAGDSTARMWFPAFSSLGKQMGFEVVLYSGNGCNVLGFESQVLVKDCQTYSDGIDRTFAALEPNAVVLVQAALDRQQRQGEAWNSSLRSFVERRQGQGASLGSIGDIPYADFDIRDCLGDHKEWSECDFDREEALRAPTRWRDFQARVFDRLQVVQIDPSAFMCGPETCPIALSGPVIVYRDKDHVTPGYSAEVGRKFGPFVRKLLPSISQSGSG